MLSFPPSTQDTITLDADNGGKVKIPRQNILSMKIEKTESETALIVNYITGDREVLPLTERNQKVFDEF